jgi:hypothetical protein
MTGIVISVCVSWRDNFTFQRNSGKKGLMREVQKRFGKCSDVSQVVSKQKGVKGNNGSKGEMGKNSK